MGEDGLRGEITQGGAGRNLAEAVEIWGHEGKDTRYGIVRVITAEERRGSVRVKDTL